MNKIHWVVLIAIALLLGYLAHSPDWHYRPLLIPFMAIGFLWPLTVYISGRNLLLVIRSRRVSFKPIALFVLTILQAPLALLAYAPPEGIFLLNPGIDTTYASGYSEKAFAEIRVGMSENDVRMKLGEPLSAFPGYDREYDYILSYTGDGACSWGDFAWKHRWVKIKKGLVQGIDRGWSYD